MRFLGGPEMLVIIGILILLFGGGGWAFRKLGTQAGRLLGGIKHFSTYMKEGLAEAQQEFADAGDTVKKAAGETERTLREAVKV